MALGSTPATTKIFSHFPLLFFQTPLGEKASIYFMKGQNLTIVMIKPFQPTSYGSSPEGEVFLVDTEKVF